MRRTVRSADRPEHEILGRILREAREAAGLTQRDLAKHLGRTQAFVWKVETGKQHIDVPTLLDMARLINTAADELIRSLQRELD